MRCAPARPVRACFVRSCRTDAVQEHDLRTTPAQCNARRTLSSHFTVHASHPALRTSQLHFALDTSSHLKSRELFSPHLSSSHLIPSLLTCLQIIVSYIETYIIYIYIYKYDMNYYIYIYIYHIKVYLSIVSQPAPRVFARRLPPRRASHHSENFVSYSSCFPGLSRYSISASPLMSP